MFDTYYSAWLSFALHRFTPGDIQENYVLQVISTKIVESSHRAL